MKSYHHNSNDYILSSHINITFDELVSMDNSTFEKWVIEFREEVKRSWVDYNQPPIRTIDDKTIVSQMERLTDMSMVGTFQIDTMTNTEDCIVMKSPINCTNTFFPNMGKMKDINTTNMEGESLWDYFVEGKKTSQFIQSIKRNFKFDSFYKFSPVLKKNSPHSLGCKDGKRWVKTYNEIGIPNHNFWLEPMDKIQRGLIYIKGNVVEDLIDKGLIKSEHFNGGNIEFSKNQLFRFRIYREGQQIFPIGLNFLKQGLVMMGVNFPPTISRFIYHHFTKDLDNQSEIIIYDPSSGYGGRLMGCLSLNSDRNIHYIGTDPNTENWISDLGISRYEYMGRYFNNNIKRRYQTTFETFMEGSEVIHLNKEFQKYKGKIDFIFTSPPYFGAEGYSEDETQSFKKFPSYEEWRDGFLKQTLETCVEYLKPDRWMCWNIADVQFNGKYYPLERDSVEMMKSLGMLYQQRYKMVLSGPVQSKNIKKHTRLPSTKNFCGLRGGFKKYEPIFCFYKPNYKSDMS